MDGGVRQEEMAERLKREIKENTHLRRGMREVRNSDGCSDLSLRDEFPTHSQSWNAAVL